ncbi:hypothetical protein C6W27_09340 [Bacillus paralicheniformis]|uniref:hypothetical protein n=1 Tax=Bacillus paralicheniformis TaxID=1648923 RepID=UPI000D03B582|nr:hypothetical protein [Bacillus paralicheniformis]PRS16591.1 hypothetical protein C6W27_09340 [Bacillus paralicheniformis]
MTKYELYTQGLVSAIADVFNEESDNYMGDLKDADLTEFFTAANMALTMLFNEFTDDDKNAIEFTHVLNGLAVQKAIENVKGATE